jgi:hypothetical protein
VTAIVKMSIEGQAQALDVALRAASALKGARGLLPEALKSEGEIVAVLLAGQELGLPPMAALRGLQIVRGKVIISYDTMIALLRRAGYRIEWLASTATEAALRLTAADGSSHTETWTTERAKKAGLWGQGTWGKYPDTMLRARCVSSAARAFAGEVLLGVYVEESGEREEIAAPVVRMQTPAASEPAREAPQSIEDAIIEAEAACGAPEAAKPAARARLTDCRDEPSLAAWIAANGVEVLRRGENAIARVVAQATSLGIEGEDEHGENSSYAWVTRRLGQIMTGTEAA